MSLLLKTALVCTVATFAATAVNDTAVRHMGSQFVLEKNPNQTKYDESEQEENTEEEIRTLGCGSWPCNQERIAMMMG